MRSERACSVLADVANHRVQLAGALDCDWLCRQLHGPTLNYATFDSNFFWSSLLHKYVLGTWGIVSYAARVYRGSK